MRLSDGHQEQWCIKSAYSGRDHSEDKTYADDKALFMFEKHLEDVELYSSESNDAVKASSESVRPTLAVEKTEVVLITQRCRGRLIPTIKDWLERL